MAIIPEFNAPLANQVVRPNETGESAIQRAAVMGERRASVAGDLIARAGQEKGQAIAGLGKLAEQGINDFGEHEFLMDASDQGPKLANATVAWQNSLNDASQKLDPKDPQAFQAFHDQQMETLRNQFMQGVRTTKGQARADELFNQFSAHAQNQTTAAYAEIAGAKTHADAVNTIHTLSQAVGADLSGLQNAHDQWDHQMAIYKSAPGTDAHQIASLSNLTEEGHKEIDTSALKAAVEAPHANLDAIQKMTDANGFKYVDKGTIDSYVKQARRANEVEARMGQAEARQARMENQQKTYGDIVAAHTDPNTGRVDPGLVTAAHQALASGKINADHYFSAITGAERSAKAFQDSQAIPADPNDPHLAEVKKDVYHFETPDKMLTAQKVFDDPLIPAKEKPELYAQIKLRDDQPMSANNGAAKAALDTMKSGLGITDNAGQAPDPTQRAALQAGISYMNTKIAAAHNHGVPDSALYDPSNAEYIFKGIPTTPDGFSRMFMPKTPVIEPVKQAAWYDFITKMWATKPEEAKAVVLPPTGTTAPKPGESAADVAKRLGLNPAGAQ